MTLKNLLIFFENYYGEKYTGVFQSVMLDYLSGYSESFYQAVASVIVKRFSRTFNKAPGLAEIEKHMEEILGMIPKPEALPEPLPERDYEAHERAMQEIREIFRQKDRGPMADTLEKTVEALLPQS
jgi:hypothetical protein